MEQRARSFSTGAIVAFVLGNSKSAGVLPPEFEALLTNDMTQEAVNVPFWCHPLFGNTVRTSDNIKSLDTSVKVETDLRSIFIPCQNSSV